MSIKKISIKVNNSKETIEQYSVTGGENGAGQLKQPLHINAQKDVNYLLIDESTQFAPENIAVKRVDKNLVIAFEGGDVESPDLIIENYFAENGAIGYQEGDANLIIGQYENGQYFPYVPESAVKADAISQLADGQAAGQAIGGDALPPLWAFNPWWLAALVPLIGIPAVAISGGGGGGGHSKVVDHAPIAGDDSAHAKHNTPVTIHVTANDSDVDGDLNPNSIRIVKEGSKGTVTIGKDGKIIYTPNKGEYGVDTITYVVKDRAGHESNVATITVKIDAAPEAKDDSAATKESKPVTIDMENNYSDKDGDVDHSSLAIKTNGGKGFAKFVNGKLVYQPNKGEVGTDTITYTVTDKNGNVSEDATITINIDAPPVANDDSAKANKATPVELDVLDNDTDLDGDIDPTTLVVVGEPTKGTVKVVDGKLVYTANPDATGQDTITYLVKDKNGNVSNKATVTIDITEPPVANEDEADTRHNTPVEIDITANDTDLDGDLDKNSVVITQPGTKGTVTIGEDGKLIYTPNKGEHGTDTIKYTVKDSNGNVSEEATVTITIDAPPVANEDKADTRHNTPVEIDITANDTDLDGDLDKNSVVITNPGTKGTVTIGEDGKLIYTPNKGEHGTDTITYTIKDKNGNVSEEATVTVTIDAPPVAGNDVADTRHNKPVEIDITSNDTDKDGDLDKNSVVITQPGTKGTVTIGEDGKLIYTPNKGEHGTDTITYTIKDKNGNVSEEATVTITIDAPPVANEDKADTRHNTPIEIDITANDTDLDGDLDKNSVVITQPGTKGTVTIGEDGKLIYTPNKGEHGTDTIKYTVKDSNGNVSNEATVTITIDAPPVAGNDVADTRHNKPVEIDITANDTDKDGDLDKNSVVITQPGTKGTVTIGEDGKLIYTPNPGATGTDTITYTIKDKNGNVSEEATVTVTIDAPPVAGNDVADTRHNKPVEIDITANDTDLDGDLDKNSVVITQPGTKGTVTIGEDGKLIYTPNKGEHGTDTITYTIKDKNGNVSEEATVTVTIDAPPVAGNDVADTRHNKPVEIDITANDTDLDGDLDKNSVVITNPGTKGTVTIGEDGKLTYTPNKGEHGTDTITYTIKDKNGNVSEEATVTVTIDAPPVAGNDVADTRHNQPVEIDITANDTDKDGDLDKNSVVITQPGTKGTVTIGEDGKLIYTPNKGEHGTDTIKYTVKDSNGNVSEEATVTITIDAPPVANEDKADTRHNTPVEIDITANDTDLDGDLDKNSVVITQPCTKGTVTIGEDGKLIYTPNPGATGTDTITYTVKDKNGNVSNEATVTINIDAPPVAVDDKATTKESVPVTIDVLANDTDLDKDIDPSTLVIKTNGSKGTATIVDGKLVYTPNAGEVGTDTITYQVFDKNGNVSNEATVTINIDAPPVAVDDTAATKESVPVTIDVLVNDTDLDKDIDPSTLVIKTNGSKGTATIVDGKLVYTPNAGEVGTDTITYQVFDKNGNVSNEATVTVDIDAAPVAVDDKATTKESVPVTIDVLANDTDLDKDIDPSTLVIKTNGSKGTATIVDGKLVYTPNAGEVGTDTITYQVFDKNGNVSNEATVTINIDAPPVAVDDTAATKESVPVTIDVLANDTDLDKDIDPSTLVIKTNGSKGTATIVDGKLVYTPNAGEVGTDTITYQVFDKNGNVSNEATVTVDIDAAPVAVDDKATTKESVPVTIDVLANDTDLDKDIDPSTLVIKTNGSKGTATIVDGKLVYTPNAGEVGTDTITYQVFDKNGNVSNEATVTVDIDAAPVAKDDSAKANKATPVEIDVLGNDTDLDNDIDPNTLAVVEQPSQGTVSIVNGKLVYTPNADAKGTDTITYTVKDANGNVSNKATVTIVINEPPVAGDDHGQTKQGVPTIIDVLINDKDPDGDLDKSTLHIEKNGSKGTATFDADGKLIYTPKPGATGQDTITYTVKDKDGSISNTATVTIDITPTQTTPTEVFEKGLRTDGTAGDKSPVTVHGVIELSNPTDKPTTPSDIKIIEPTTKLTSGGEPISWESTDNGFVGKTPNGKEVISVKVTDTPTADGSTKVNYEVNLKGLVDHPAGKDSLNIEFGVKNGTDEVKTEIVVHDDKPEASNVELSVEPPVENTFYANLIISLDLSSSMGRDDSGIQGGNTASGMKTRYDAALDSIDSVLSSYEERLNSADAGEVRVSINGFAKQASAIGGAPGYPMDQPYWCTISEAKQIIEGLRGAQTLRPDWHVIGVDTNYDAALQQVISIFQKTSSSGMEPIDVKDINGKLDNTLFVITDGIPNYGNQSNSQDPVAGNGIAPTSPNGFVPGSPNTDIGEDSWKAFLTEKGIRSVAIGIGQDMLNSVGGKTGEEFIQPIAFDGQKGQNNDANDVIVLKDMSSLGNILSKYVPNENTIESSFSKANDGKETLSFGADGMKSISIEVDGHTYKYDPKTKGITSDNLDKSMWVDFGQGELAVKTDAGGLLSISLGEKNFGHLTYRPGATRPTGMEKETFTLTLTDNDGTNGKSSISVDISKLKESGNTGLNDTDLTALKLFSPESAMELHGVDTDVNATSSHSTGFMNASLDALQETQSAII